MGNNQNYLVLTVYQLIHKIFQMYSKFILNSLIFIAEAGYEINSCSVCFIIYHITLLFSMFCNLYFSSLLCVLYFI